MPIDFSRTNRGTLKTENDGWEYVIIIKKVQQYLISGSFTVGLFLLYIPYSTGHVQFCTVVDASLEKSCRALYDKTITLCRPYTEKNICTVQ